jgi:hypothetical protein
MSTTEIEGRALSRRAELVLAALRAHEPELRAYGVESLSLFGCLARGDDDRHSDVDIVVRLGAVTVGGFAYFDDNCARIRDCGAEFGGRRPRMLIRGTHNAIDLCAPAAAETRAQHRATRLLAYLDT